MSTNTTTLIAESTTFPETTAFPEATAFESQQDIEDNEMASHEEMLLAVTTLLYTVLVLCIAAFHSWNVYRDYFTAERSSLSHRRNKPKVTTGYKRMGYLTLASVYLYLLLIFATAIQYNFSFGHCMFAWTVFEKFGFFGSKCTLYLVYILRLHEVYGQSSYGYNAKTLKCIAGTIIFYCVSVMVFVEVGFAVWPYYVDDTDGVYPYFCQTIMQEPYVNISGLLIILLDFVASVSSIIAFNRPLKKVIEATLKYTNEDALVDVDKRKRFGKMMYTGFKYKVLVWTASISTFLWIISLMLGDYLITTIFINLDFVLNPICLLLMTPYYPSNKYYEQLCFPCIFCCDRNRNSYSSKADEQDREKKRGMVEATATSTKLPILRVWTRVRLYSIQSHCLIIVKYRMRHILYLIVVNYWMLESERSS